MSERIDVRGLEQIVPARRARAIEAVRDASFSVRRGEFVALLGPSGSGKSTILNMIATLVKPSGGEILIDGKPVIAGKATPDVGYVFQRDTLFPWRTVADNIGYGLELAGVADGRARGACRGLRCARPACEGFEQAYPSALSGGMRQRAALMRTLVVEPQILLMDEPFGALDTHTKIDMHEVLLRIWDREQQTVLFVTHDLGEALDAWPTASSCSRRVPAGSRTMFEVDFARPRDAVKVRETPRYAELFQHIWHSARRRIRHKGAAHESVATSRPARWHGRSLICVAVLSIWQWGYDLHARFPSLVPDLLDPYFVSKPSEIFEHFLILSCLKSKLGVFNGWFNGDFRQVHGAQRKQSLDRDRHHAEEYVLRISSSAYRRGFAAGLLLGRSDRLERRSFSPSSPR